MKRLSDQPLEVVFHVHLGRQLSRKFYEVIQFAESNPAIHNWCIWKNHCLHYSWNEIPLPQEAQQSINMGVACSDVCLYILCYWPCGIMLQHQWIFTFLGNPLKTRVSNQSLFHKCFRYIFHLSNAKKPNSSRWIHSLDIDLGGN